MREADDQYFGFGLVYVLGVLEVLEEVFVEVGLYLGVVE